jgi:hypothetical protein
MRKNICFAVIILFLAASTIAVGADFWEKKEYTKWSKKECAKMLTNSPWAKDHTLIDQGMQRSTRESDDGRQFYVKYQVQFATALPIRQAQVRQNMIAQNYDDLNNEQKQQMDQSAEAYLAKQFPDAIILVVSYETNSRTRSMDLIRHWQSQTTELLKNNVFLRNSRGDRVDLAAFQPYANEPGFQFVFPRQTAEGKPLVEAEDKNLMLEFAYPKAGPIGEGDAFMEFKPKKMVFKDTLTY